jgi:predicted nucleic acid-binding protein
MLLDTNAYSALALGEQSVVEVISGASEIKLPLPVIAELRYGFVKGSRSERNEQALQRFLAQEQVSIAVPTLKTTELYAQLQLFCVKRGKSLSHNDLWIAALARETDDTLVTFDEDFKPLLEIFGSKLIILKQPV